VPPAGLAAWAEATKPPLRPRRGSEDPSSQRRNVLVLCLPVFPPRATSARFSLHIARPSACARLASHDVNRVSHSGCVATQPGNRGPADVQVVRPTAIFTETLTHAAHTKPAGLTSSAGSQCSPAGPQRPVLRSPSQNVPGGCERVPPITGSGVGGVTALGWVHIAPPLSRMWRHGHVIQRQFLQRRSLICHPRR
jgi:hypothetical protein